MVPGTVPLAEVWGRAVQAMGDLQLEPVELVARDDDPELQGLAAAAGFAPAAGGGNSWLVAEDRPEVAPLSEGFRLVDRAQASGPHPMRERNGAEVESRLRQCSLYEPGLDLAVETVDGENAGYALFWFDPVTNVGLVEPMRVHDAYQRRGLARALLTAGVERLAQCGARRMKVGYSTDVARSLYTGSGFRVSSTDRLYTRG